MDPQQLSDLIMQKKWVALMALLIGLVVRLLKSDTKIPIDIPPQYRVWLALGLAPIAGAFDKVAAGNSWTTSMVEGAIAAVLAIVGQNVFIDSLRGGKEVVIPGLIKKDTPPGPGKPPSIPPTADNQKTMQDVLAGKDVDTKGLFRTTFLRRYVAMPLIGFGMMVFLNACHFFSPSELPGTVLTLEDIACIIENAFVDNATLNTVCRLLSPEQQAAAKKVAAAHREDVARKLSAARAQSCGDAGTPDGGGK